MAYTLLLLDADGTILDFASAEGKALQAVCDASGLCVSPDQLSLYRQINDTLWRSYERGEVSQDRLRTLRFERFLEAIDQPGHPDLMADAFVQALSLQTDEIDGAYAFLETASKRMPVIIVTNGIASVQRSRLSLSRLGAFVSGHVISGEVGMAKPDPRILRYAIEQSGQADAHALMVGDEPRSDIAAAVAAGIDSCWYNPSGRENTTGFLPTHEVRTLAEVLTWL